MKLSDLIEEYIRNIMESNEIAELKRSELATRFNCVPSQINYVIQTRFIPELGFYVESRRGGGGYIKIKKINLNKSEYISNILEKIDSNLSQSVIDVYLNDFIMYNILDEKTADLISIAVSDKSLSKVNSINRDSVRADIFKNLIINLI